MTMTMIMIMGIGMARGRRSCKGRRGEGCICGWGGVVNTV
jgi:hypothetical protein